MSPDDALPLPATRETATVLLQAWAQGDALARDRLIPLVYGELRRMAAGYLRRERAGHTLQPTALVHETFVRLVDQARAPQSRAHFFGICARLMREILVDHARGRGAQKRGGLFRRVEMESVTIAADEAAWDMLALDEALRELEAMDARQAQVVELRFFGGLTLEETADAVGVAPITVRRDWETARLWLYRRLERGRPAT